MKVRVVWWLEESESNRRVAVAKTFESWNGALAEVYLIAQKIGEVPVGTALTVTEEPA